MPSLRSIFRALLLACLFAGLTACEERVISTNPGNDYMGMHFAPTQVETPPPPPDPPMEFPNPFKWIGDGVSGLFKGGGDNKNMQVNSQGQSVQVPSGYTGDTNFSAADGRNYKLHFQNGALVGVDPQFPPAPPAAKPAPAQPAQ